ncbi:Histone-lysine N-methyltransferase SETMAR [Melipona quadrifasciata]|uniref:Histone-lysine N-methyltransferase SETMAR n=1 Tax=Melipona quadrifasciata TaxID=166423 RepID=A0A0N0U5I9_9HYME|nr:Histone-lysine N-methyltransferase SETMAR [Melipona quadrifasciata]
MGKIQKEGKQTQGANKICAVYSGGAVAERTVRKWFARFKAGDFNLKDQERSSRASTTDEDQIKTLIENNPCYTIRKLAEMLNMSKSTIHEHFVKPGYINRFDHPPYSPNLALSDFHLFQYTPLQNSLNGKNFNSLAEIDNVRPHVSLITRQKLLELGWDVLSHPPYLPDLAPSDFYLFRSLQNFLNGKNFNSLAEIKNHVEKFFVEKPERFWNDGIFKLLERWRKVIEQNGTYMI